METYISSKWEIYQKKGLFIACFFWWLFIIPCVKDLIHTGNYFNLIFIAIIVAQMGTFIYWAKTPSIVLIKDGQIIVKAAFKEERFDIRNFKEVTKRWGSSVYEIHFLNGQKFWFRPKLSGNLYYDLRSKVDLINTEINEIKEQYTNARQ